MASALATATTRPRFPQRHSGPSGATVWWPSSPAVPIPRCRCPSTTTPPPTPVPTVTNTAVRQPRAAPSCDSPTANARASLTSTAGAPSASPTGPRDRGARPVAREVGKERGRAGVDVEDTGHADADRVGRYAVESALADLRKAGDDPVRPLVRVRRGRARGRHSRKAVPFDKRPLHVRPAEVEPDVERHRAVHPPSTVRTAPVTNGAVAR